MKVSKISIIIFTYIIFPISSVEIFSQFKYYENLGEQAYISKLVKGTKIDNPHKYGLHKSNVTRVETQTTLYDWNKEIKSNSKPIIFKTDQYGTIEPSTFSNAIREQKPYIIFCGGSTTENSHVYQDYRMVDVFGKLNSINTVNAAKSAKNLQGCIDTIGFLLKQSNKIPSKIIISNNVNTLWEFGRSKIKNISPEETSIKNFVRLIVPGIYKISKEVKATMYMKSIKRFNHSILSSYEKSLAQGCCHGAASINKEKSFQIDWMSKRNQDLYSQYVKQLELRLNKYLSENNFAKENIIIIIQPNSYNLNSIASKYDYRQPFHSFDGSKLSLEESGKITKIYDNIYSNSFKTLGYNVISIPENYMRSIDFYDAAHLTQTGAKRIAEFLSQKIKLN